LFDFFPSGHPDSALALFYPDIRNLQQTGTGIMVDKRKIVVKQEPSNKRASRGKEKMVEKPVSRKVRPLYLMQPLDVK
jgi:hypothetical protein